MTDFYLDFSAGAGGDGTFATPWNLLASIAGTAPDDTVWCRRTTFTDTSVGPDYASQIPAGIALVGWPITGDSRYAARPSAAQAAWDGDAGTHATIVHSPVAGGVITNNLQVSSFVPVTRTYTMARFKIRRNCTGSLVSGVVGYFGTGAVGIVAPIFVTEKCAFEVNQNTSTAIGLICIGGYTSNNVHGQSVAFTWADTASSFLAINTTIPVHLFYITSQNIVGYQLSVSFTMAFTQSIVTSSGAGAGAGFAFSIGSTTAATSVEGTFDRVTFIHNVVRTTSNFWGAKIPSPKGIFFVRCIFTTVAGGTNGFNRFDTYNYTYYDCDFINFNSLNINDAGARLSIRQFIQGAPDSTQAAINIPLGGSYVTAGYASFATGTFRDIAFGAPFDSIGSGTVHMRSVAESGAGYTLNFNGRVIAQNVNGAVGTYKRTTLVGVAQSVPSYRSGGARYGIQLVPALNTATRVEGCPTEEPGFETLRFALLPGMNTVTVYCAHIGYATAPTRASVWAEVEAPQVSTRLRVSTRDTTGSALTADTSNWNGLAGSPVFFKLVLTVLSSAQVVAAIRVYAGDGTGSVFVDPKAVVS